ncbi:hypothetical protein [Flavobacterium sp. UBA6195]|uniref:hypothetical protein n=1 Tax=Flavobacterium sp. UBA6195 TaxID=1946554 RepID=UPI0025C08A6E|nr:hypothetical protein [Flavobacterium sp. UBA6195]
MEFIISTHACFFIKYNKNLFYLEPREGIRAGAGARKAFPRYRCGDISERSGLREVTVVELQKLTKLFNLTADQILNYDENLIPKEVVIEDKSTIEQMQLLQQLDEDDKTTVFKIIDKMLTTKKFKDFFNKNVAAL